MKPEFQELTDRQRADGVDLCAKVLSETTGEKLATVVRYSGEPPIYACTCQPIDGPQWECPHILLILAAVAAAVPRRAAT